jgi:alkylation response protein AidB-like acyl-CoA dehydrogenase
MVARTAQLADQGKLTDQQAAISKAFTMAKMRETVSWARELLGGMSANGRSKLRGRWQEVRQRNASLECHAP